MHPYLIFSIVFAILLFIIVFLSVKHDMLKDVSRVIPKPHSWARTQLCWWMLIIFSSLITIIIIKHRIPLFDSSTLILLGISSLTIASARLIDVSDKKRIPTVPKTLSQDIPSEGFLIDILSDNEGVSIHRLQSVILNFVFGLWYINAVLCNLQCNIELNLIIPNLNQNSLILLGLSSATFTALKTAENK